MKSAANLSKVDSEYIVKLTALDGVPAYSPNVILVTFWLWVVEFWVIEVKLVPENKVNCQKKLLFSQVEPLPTNRGISISLFIVQLFPPVLEWVAA